MKKRILLVAMIAVLALFPGSSLGATAFWNFSGGMDSNFTYSENYADFSLDDDHGELRLSKPAGGGSDFKYASVDSTFQIGGNFDIRVDYKLNLTLQAGNQVHMGMLYDVYAIVRSLEGGYQNYHIWRSSGGYGQVPTNDLSGSMRFVRTGTTVTAYYKSPGADFTSLYTYTDYGSQDVTIFMNIVNNGGSSNALDVSFDNLYIQADYLPSGLPVPLPPSVLLLGSGLLVLAGWRGLKKN